LEGLLLEADPDAALTQLAGIESDFKCAEARETP
jgi:hypothetical protein